ncbi:MAG TPA: MOSC N-terminal beta barrel domain-containing protein [Bacteroidota bacterium]|nr:MOSC N-terminal beta barrel domain-containing protein [Bacteroidota bacterium]
MLKLTQINIYPIKSTKGISLQSARLDDRGLEFDRRWMVVDEQGQFMTQRTLPAMALIHVALQDDYLSVTSRGIGALSVPVHSGGPTMRVQIFDDSLDAVDTGDDSSRWFSQVLGTRCRLVRMPEEPSRFVNLKYAPPKTAVGFADAFPLMLLSEASLKDLNERLAEPVPMNRFRPNLVVNGSYAFEEDTWRAIQIGAVTLRVAKPCARCTVPTVDQNTAETGKEPIRTLSSYRTRDSKVYFGQNLIHEEAGVLSVGDEIRAITT